MIKNSLNTAKIFNIPLFGGSKNELLKMIKKDLVSNKKLPMWWINTPNAEQVVQGEQDDTFRSYFDHSSVNLPDGASVVLASRLLSGDQSSRVQERISGVDLMQDLIILAQESGWRVFLLGGEGQVAEFASQKLKVRHLGLEVAYDPGPQVVGQESSQENEELLEKIAKFRTDILFVGFGAPKQERWVNDNRDQLEKMGVRLVMVVGGAFDMISGNIARAPKWMRQFGLEWLWRLIQEPWRWKRQLRLFRFWSRVLKVRLGIAG